MTTIPAGTKFHGVDSSVDTRDKGSASRNSLREAYTIEDITDSVLEDWVSSQVTVGTNTVSVWTPKTTNANKGIRIENGGRGFIQLGKGDYVTGKNAIGIGYSYYGISRYYPTASGETSVAIGSNNTKATQFNSIAIGEGAQCYSSSAAAIGRNARVYSGSLCSFAGPMSNINSSYYSVSLGGANIQTYSSYSFAFGYYTNIGANCSYSIAIGNSYVYSPYSSVFGFGTVSSNSPNSTVIGRGQVYSNSQGSVALREGKAFAPYSFATMGAKTYAYGQKAFGNPAFISSSGTVQESEVIYTKLESGVTTGGTFNLFLDNSSLEFEPDVENKAYNIVGEYVAVVTNITGTATGVSVGDIISEDNLFAMKEVSGTLSIVGSVTNTAKKNDTSMATASMGYSIVSNRLRLTFTAPTFSGGGSLEIRVACRLKMVECGF